MATKAKTPWARHVNRDSGETNPLKSSARRDFMDGGETSAQKERMLVENFLSNTKIDKTGPFLAIVLKVLSGPQVNNEASTNGGNLSSALNIKGFKDSTNERREEQQKPAPIKIIARIPEVHNFMDWPETVEDEDVISMHSEFHQFDENPDFELIRPGSMVWVQFYTLDHISSKSGFPSGVILGLYDKGSPVADEALISPVEEFGPPCKAFRNLAEPAAGLYRGNTEANPVLLSGPPIVKLKNRIVTGLFGNGSLATKANFNEALKVAGPSFIHNIPGGAPDANNAFIWVGQIKSNGYLDVINRPGFGRETIIYAPYSLDTSSPIEIKYYFHDKNGFGNAFASGVDSQQEAIQSAINQPNDFKDKIAPAIKDYIKDGRNIILVIPELLHSKGLNTRVGLQYQQYKEQLERVTVSEELNLFNITPFVSRELRSFDRSYIGGNFTDFHGDVLDVVDSFLGSGTSDNVTYISLVGDGIGALTISSMCQNFDTVTEIRNNFKIQRVDFIDTGIDNATISPGTFDFVPPSVALYTKLVRPAVDEEARKLQFNYISSVSPANASNFFNGLDKLNTESLDVLSLFKENNKPPSGNGEIKFTFPVAFSTSNNDASGEATDVVCSFHIAKQDNNAKAGYALTVQNLNGNQTTLIKPDTNSSLFAAGNTVPDHAAAATAAQAASDLAKIQKRINELYQRIVFFENGIISWINSGIDAPCYDESPYQIYCVDGQISFVKGSRFFQDYLNYITDKIDLEEIKIVNNFESQLLESNIDAGRLTKVKQEAQSLLTTAKQKIKQPYAAFGNVKPEKSIEILKQRFDINDFFTPAAAQSIDTPESVPDSFPELTNLAKILSAPAAYQKIINKVDNTLEKVKSRAVKLSPECSPPPIKLGEAVSQDTLVSSANPAPSVENCGDIKIALVDSFADLKQMIDYVPDKNRFSFQGKHKVSKTKTKLENVDGFKVGTFKYKARGPGGQLTVKESPPIWSCITGRISNAWETACNQSNYVPFEVVNGIRGYKDYKGNTAYNIGVSLHSFGLAFDVDPHLAGFGLRSARSIHSVFTGAWSQTFLEEHANELYRLGVFRVAPSILLTNAIQAQNEIREAESWEGAPSAYKGTAEGSIQASRYSEIMSKSKGSLIVKKEANPTLWLLTFCETAKMRWGNLNFLKKRYKGGKVWNSAEKKRIAEIYGIPNVVDRVKEVSWKSKNIESHMHFQFWNGDSIIRWSEINKFKG